MTSADLSASGYQATLRELRQRLRLAQIAIFRQNSQAIIVLEGYGAAGKGGVIRELSYAWDLVDSQFIRLVHRARKRQLIHFCGVSGIDFLHLARSQFLTDHGTGVSLLSGLSTDCQMVSMNRVFLKLMPLRKCSRITRSR